MNKPISQKLRKFIQLVSLVGFLSPTLALTGFNTKSIEFKLLGLTFERDTIFIPIFFLISLFFLIYFVSFKKGRVFCSYLCPMHLYLELFRKPTKKKLYNVLRPVARVLLALVASYTAISILFPLKDQIELYKQPFPQPILIASVIAFTVFFMVVVIYRERFCRYACPYSIPLILTQSESSVTMTFDEESGRCINCHQCDKSCPYKLDVRKESSTLLCSNCSLCQQACRKVLGEGKEVLSLKVQTIDPEEDS